MGKRIKIRSALGRLGPPWAAWGRSGQSKRCSFFTTSGARFLIWCVITRRVDAPYALCIVTSRTVQPHRTNRRTAYIGLTSDSEHAAGCRYDAPGRLKAIVAQSDPDFVKLLETGKRELRLLVLHNGLRGKGLSGHDADSHSHGHQNVGRPYYDRRDLVREKAFQLSAHDVRSRRPACALRIGCVPSIGTGPAFRHPAYRSEGIFLWAAESRLPVRRSARHRPQLPRCGHLLVVSECRKAGNNGQPSAHAEAIVTRLKLHATALKCGIRSVATGLEQPRPKGRQPITGFKCRRLPP